MSSLWQWFKDNIEAIYSELCWRRARQVRVVCVRDGGLREVLREGNVGSHSALNELLNASQAASQITCGRLELHSQAENGDWVGLAGKNAD